MSSFCPAKYNFDASTRSLPTGHRSSVILCRVLNRLGRESHCAWTLNGRYTAQRNKNDTVPTLSPRKDAKAESTRFWIRTEDSCNHYFLSRFWIKTQKRVIIDCMRQNERNLRSPNIFGINQVIVPRNQCFIPGTIINFRSGPHYGLATELLFNSMTLINELRAIINIEETKRKLRIFLLNS